MTDVTLAHENSTPLGPSHWSDVDLSPTDVKVGEQYYVLLPDHDAGLLLEFKQKYSNGSLKFTKLGTDQEFYFDGRRGGEWDAMRSDRRACRLSLAKRGRGAAEIEDIDPYALLDPDEVTITLKERSRRLTAAKRLSEARTLRFYVIRYDETPAGTGHVGVRNFIEDNYQDARKAGLYWKPSPGAVLRAVDGCGLPGERPLAAFLNRRGRHDRSKRWPQFTIDLAVKMNSDYWTIRQKRHCDVISAFYDEFDEENDKRSDKDKLIRPSEEMLRLWINAGESYWSWRWKYGEPAARRRFKGHGRAIEATQPLEYVMIDHTRIDAWAAIYDEDGTKVLVERPWLTLAIDVYSRMILGAVLTYEGPSVYSTLLCLRQVVRQKDFLIERFGYHKGATDGWGKPITVIVDNAWEFVGISFQVCCEAAGIHVIWAPVKCPEFKSYAERAFGVLNELVWHRLDQGIPLKPQEMTAAGLDPRPKALQTIEWLYDRMWEAIVTILHLEEHGEKKIVPAIRWRDGLVAEGRPTLDDVGELDKVLGRSARCLLTTSGIILNNHRFHDKEITSELLDRLLRHAPKRGQRKGRSSGKVAVLGTWDPGDCSFIQAWDWVLKKNIRIPNSDPEYSKGLSWETAEKIRNFAHEKNLLLHSDREKHAARAAYDRSLRDKHPDLPFGQARKSAAELSKPQLVAGEYVEKIARQTPLTAQGVVEVPQTLPASERTDDRIPDKGMRRGGAPATKRANAARRRNQQKQKPSSVVPTSPKEQRGSPPLPTGSLMTVAEAQVRLAALAADLD